MVKSYRLVVHAKRNYISGMKKLFFAVTVFVSFSVSAQYHSLLWKISGNGLQQPSYLFGTMHTSDKRVLQKGEDVLRYFTDADAYAMELDPAESFNLSLLSKLMMGKNYSLKKMIPEREYALLDSVVKAQVGFSLKLFDHVAPVFIMTILEAASIDSDNEAEHGDEVLDLLFYRKAKEAKKKIIGIETVDEQLKALTALSYEEQADMLVHSIREYERSTQTMKEMVRFYIAQQLDSIVMLNDEDPMPEKFYKALVTDRNKRMANRIGDLVLKQSFFIAIGALHLPGEKGVIELLRKKGYIVEATN